MLNIISCLSREAEVERDCLRIINLIVGCRGEPPYWKYWNWVLESSVWLCLSFLPSWGEATTIYWTIFSLLEIVMTNEIWNVHRARKIYKHMHANLTKSCFPSNYYTILMWFLKPIIFFNFFFTTLWDMENDFYRILTKGWSPSSQIIAMMGLEGSPLL